MFGYSRYICCLQEEFWSKHILLNKGFDKFWFAGIGTFLAQKIAQEKLTKILPKNVLIPPNHILPTSTKIIFTTSYYLPTLSVKIGYIPLSASSKHQSHDLV